MLQPPGSSRSGGAAGGGKAYASKGRKTQESNTDQLRKLSKLPANKKCADCGGRAPQCVNLSMNTFICMACSGIHREINLKVKSLGHSTFTDEEVDEMRATDNDKVNAVWLQRYDPQNDRMKPPQGDQDMAHLRAWIKRKYQEKAWYGSGSSSGSGTGSTRGGSGTGGRPTPTQQPKQKSRRGGNLQPTVVEIPPEKPAESSTSVDLFANFDAPAAAPAPAAQDDWAGFGGSSQQQPTNKNSSNDDFANFGGSGGIGNHVADPFASPQPPPQQNFANFGGGGGGDPFVQTMPASGPTSQQNFASFGGPTPPQDPFAQQIPPSQPGGFANFNQQQVPLQQPMQMSSGGGFASFDQHPVPSQPPLPQQQQQQGGGFANFDQLQQPTPVHPAPSLQPQQGFANFGPPQQQQQQQPLPLVAAPPQQQYNFGNFNEMPSQQLQPQQQQSQDPFGSIPPAQDHQQNQQPMMAPNHASQMQPSPPQMEQPSLPPPPAPQREDDPFANMQQGGFVANQQPPPPSNTQQQMQQQFNDPFANMQNIQEQHHQPSQFGGTMGSDVGTSGMSLQQPPLTQQQPPQTLETTDFGNIKVEDPMDAFNHLSINSNNNNDIGAVQPTKMGMTMERAQVPKYTAKQIVCYTANGERSKAQIVKVHLDEKPEPFYTVMLPYGKEVQADDGNLEPLDPAMERIESKLLSLSSAQLHQVEAYLSNVALSVGAAPPTPMRTMNTNIPTAPQMEEPTNNPIPAHVDPASPSGMSHVSQLTQPPATVATHLQMPSLSAHVGGGGMMGGTMNGGPSGALSTIPSPHPAEKAQDVAGQISAPSTTDSCSNPGMQVNQPQQQQSAMGMQQTQAAFNQNMAMVPPSNLNIGGGMQQIQPTSSGMGMSQQEPQPSIAPTNNTMASNESFIPSPPGKASSSGHEQIGSFGHISAPPFGQQPPQQQAPPPQMQQMSNIQMQPSQMHEQQLNSQMLPPQMYGQQMNNQMAPPMMQQGQMNYQMGPPQMNYNQMNGQSMNNQIQSPQMMMPGQTLGGQVQHQQQPVQMAQSQAPLSPQGNPFDMY